MSVLNMEALAATRLQPTPWPHVRLTSAVLPSRRRELEDQFPDTGYHWFLQYLLAEAKGDQAAMQEHSIMTRTLIDLGSVELNRESGALAEVWHELAKEMIKQHLFCKSRISEVGHLASMFR